MSGLSARECVPCRGGVPPLEGEEIQKLLKELDGWEVVNEHHLKKRYKFGDFRESLATRPAFLWVLEMYRRHRGPSAAVEDEVTGETEPQ